MPDKYILVTDPTEVKAVLDGEVDGTQYEDGDVYADFEALLAWKKKKGPWPSPESSAS